MNFNNNNKIRKLSPLLSSEGTAPQASFWTVFAIFSKTTTYW